MKKRISLAVHNRRYVGRARRIRAVKFWRDDVTMRFCGLYRMRFSLPLKESPLHRLKCWGIDMTTKNYRIKKSACNVLKGVL